MAEKATKQEGEFTLKGKKTKPKQLGKASNEPIKVNLKEPLVELPEQEVTKVVIKNEEDAVQTQETNDSNVVVEEPKDSGNSEGVVEEVRSTEEEVESPITLIEVDEEEKVEEKVEQPKTETVVEQRQLPENIEKLVSFMEETGGTEELDEPKDVRKKKIAFKEEVAKAKNFLEGLKTKYYDEIKLRPGVTQEQQKALDFFNRYNEDQRVAEERHKDFLSKTNNFLSDDFKGFDFNVGDKKFRYGVKNPKQIAETQSDISNFIGKFLDKKGNVNDYQGYHKALYAARNADTIAQHFYEQGKADATKDIMAKSKNISNEPRKTASGDVFVGGLKVRSISGLDSSKLKIKKRKFK